MSREEPAKRREYYLQPPEVEQAFKRLKHDLADRPIHHQLDHRIAAPIFISLLA